MDNNFDFDTAFRNNGKFIDSAEIPAREIDKQFVNGTNRTFVKIGEIDCPTGNITAGDPLAYMPSGYLFPTLQPSIRPGVYELYVSIAANQNMGLRMCTLKMPVTQNKAVVYKQARSTPDTVLKFKDGGTTDGFPVDAGLAAICDRLTAEEYRSFIDIWSAENPGGNLYDDYFARLFAQSYAERPGIQRPEGDFIQWAVPQTGNKMVMCASGLGDGFYRPFWGYDEKGEICRLIIPFVNPDFFE